MVCVMPLKAYRAEGGRVVFSSKEGYVDRPLTLPCGQCIGCRVDRSRAWALRCVHEASLHDRNCFLTLTYDAKHLPADGSLRKKDWQDFAKRLRKACGPFRYFHCGEYGDANYRPHYHSIVFGLDFADTRVHFVRTGATRLFRSPLLEKLWGHGFCTIGDVTFQSAAYVARYCMKKATGPLAEQAYRRVDVITGEEYYVSPEYITMSRRPGIGAGWYDKFKDDVFPSDEVIFDGKRFRPPKFYDKAYEAEFPGEFLTVRAKRMRAVANRCEELSPARLRAKERKLDSANKLLKREI